MLLILKEIFFNDNNLIDKFFSESDVVIHLAGLNRHNDDEEIFQTNIKLAKDISNSITRQVFLVN